MRQGNMLRLVDFRHIQKLNFTDVILAVSVFCYG